MFSESMKTLWLENNRLHVHTDVPIPDPLSGEALVRVLRAGTCNTDLELIRGYYPFTGVPGHEFVGNPEGFAIARRALRPRGTLVLKSTYAGQLTIDASSLVVDENYADWIAVWPVYSCTGTVENWAN
jgi:threonine dehydrogenase-like Zn-dependent dehydrogenase